MIDLAICGTTWEKNLSYEKKILHGESKWVSSKIILFESGTLASKAIYTSKEGSNSNTFTITHATRNHTNHIGHDIHFFFFSVNDGSDDQFIINKVENKMRLQNAPPPPAIEPSGNLAPNWHPGPANWGCNFLLKKRTANHTNHRRKINIQI